MGLLLKLGLLVTIVVLSYLIFSITLSFAELVPRLTGVAETKGPFVDVFAGLLSVVLIVCVAVFFTIPLCLSIVGHGGAWLKHVVAKCAKQLGGALGVAFALYLGSTVTPDFDPGRWKVTPLSVIILASVGIAVLGIVSRGSLLVLMEKDSRSKNIAYRPTTRKCS